MRKKEKEVTDVSVMEEQLHRAEIMRLAFCDADEPYVVPVCFAYQDGVIFVHSAKEGRKLDIIKRTGKVCFEVDTYKIVAKDAPCKWTIDYTSVIGLGDAILVEDVNKKREALDVIMAHYGAVAPFEYSESALAKMLIIRIAVRSMTCKRSL
ncbi:MAG: pyridoxamine 5'-phosphate oxidase family protein [Methanomassiliicoccales archaeon]|nr:pyridoxamine 5'-phosphate oxidase family protein [Methanomassiliicoccales archaeon]